MILLLSDDLMDASKTMASARALGIPVGQCKTAAELLARIQTQEVACCIVDLHCPDLDVAALLQALASRKTQPRVLAYGSHVDAGRLRAAREAGCDEVMPRSVYFDEMPAKLALWVRSD